MPIGRLEGSARRDLERVFCALLLDPADERALRAAARQEIGLAMAPARIQRFVAPFFGHCPLHARELPAGLPPLLWADTGYGGPVPGLLSRPVLNTPGRA